MYVPGDICHGGPVETRARNQMRLSFGVQDASGIREGIARLARAIRAERG
jgi:DNA-binding transcriptional MocR family regulator